ncbi:alpha/beta-hydrolase [Cylindrobasidium torrendii FP15055 ss-10]|uniref:Alpha/beta-hydrolase n=1 Tax=Cylindrobasidium torrendii FP15055 ss-10 TaxID=1314674 RepID=A0A0D7BJV0_9AGAR|nr:alpha/beta-hydrolase [Cylindrobasidium torrendii FP15055 ss-10]
MLFPLCLLPLLPLAVVGQSVSYKENSGICETTPGVNQYSGYINPEKKSNDTFFFWFFEARSEPDDKPLTLWLNGGPGCSSMIGLFTENGPCLVNNDSSSTRFNEYSWNNYTNMLYIDQPFGAGFSEGRNIDTLDDAAKYLWQGLQTWFDDKAFKKYASRDFIFATESYGAHFGPVFIQYFQSQNDKVDSGDVDGHKINVKKLLISNGKHDPMIQTNSSIAFAMDPPGYDPIITNNTLIKEVQSAFEKDCKPALDKCNDDGSDNDCNDAVKVCTRTIQVPMYGNRDPNDLRVSDDGDESEETDDDDYSDAAGATYYLKFVRGNKSKIGARGATFDQCDSGLKARFSGAGETGRSAMNQLAQIVEAGKIEVLIWVGDADIKANWVGVHEVIAQMPWSGNKTFADTKMSTLSLDGSDVGEYKVVDGTPGITFVRIFKAGHTMPAYQPKTAATVFGRFINGDAIGGSTNSSDVGDSQPGNNPDEDDGALSTTSLTSLSVLIFMSTVFTLL